MKSFTYGELRNFLKSQSDVAYCYQGEENRGAIAFLKDNSIVVLKADGVFLDYIEDMKEASNFELWAFIHTMTDKQDFEIRQQAVNRLFEAYCIYYRYMTIFQEFPFNTN